MYGVTGLQKVFSAIQTVQHEPENSNMFHLYGLHRRECLGLHEIHQEYSMIKAQMLECAGEVWGGMLQRLNKHSSAQ